MTRQGLIRSSARQKLRQTAKDLESSSSNALYVEKRRIFLEELLTVICTFWSIYFNCTDGFVAVTTRGD